MGLGEKGVRGRRRGRRRVQVKALDIFLMTNKQVTKTNEK